MRTAHELTVVTLPCHFLCLLLANSVSSARIRLILSMPHLHAHAYMIIVIIIIKRCLSQEASGACDAEGGMFSSTGNAQEMSSVTMLRNDM